MKTPEQKAEWVISKFGKVMNALASEAAMLANAPPDKSPLSARALRVVEITDSLAKKVAPHAVCRQYCSHCCYQAVIVSSWEADRLSERTGRQRAQVAPVSRENLDHLHDAADTHSGTPCPFLKDNECSVYDVRPLVCRTYFYMGDDPDDCDILKHHGKRVPTFNFRPLHLIQGMLFINAGCDFADIREFFPGD